MGHTGIARECFAQRGNRTRSPHFKRELSGGSMSQEYIGECYEIAESSEKIYIGKVADIKITDIEKILYVKSDVDFNNINYLYVVG